MRIETNTRLVQRNRRLAQVLFFVSMGVLAAGFLVANLQLTRIDPDDPTAFLSLLLPWLVLPLGFACTIVSVRMTNLWIRRPRPEDVIQEALKVVSKKSVLYNYYHIPARHVLISPQGVFAMVTRFQDGSYSLTGDQWKTHGGVFGRLMRLLRRDDIGNPMADAHRAAAYVKSLLDKDAATAHLPVQPLIIFVDPRARLEINDPTVPVLYADERQKPNLRDYMRELAHKQPPLPPPLKKKGGQKGKAVEVADEGQVIRDIDEVADAFEDATLAR